MDGTESPKVEEGTSVKYLPYVHYLGPSDAASSEQLILSQPDKEQWENGKGAARIGVRIVSASAGRVTAEGQYGTWTYPLRCGDATLKLRGLGK